MNLGDLLLLLTPGLPLLLVLPLLRRFIPRVEYVAILPALVLLFIPGEHFIELPWLLFDAGFACAGETRLLLLMSVLLWIAAAFYLSTSRGNSERQAGGQHSTFFLLTLGANLGTILATDVVSFFTFSTLMGYGFYGLLVNAGDELVKRAGRVYLCFMVVADLLLFEALLIAASVTEEQSFDAVHQAMLDSSYSGLYLSMVVLGFALKAGFWPLHFWLPLAFRATRPPAVLLLAGVPVAMGLLGIVRWLPLGEITLPAFAIFFLALGGLAMLYAVVTALMRRQPKTHAAYITIFTTGFFTIALGAGLRDPAVWKQYANLVPVFIVSLGLGLALLTGIISWSEAKKPALRTQEKQSDDTPLWFERWSGAIVCWGRTMGSETLPRLRVTCLAIAESCLPIHRWKKVLQTGELTLQNWMIAVTLVLLVAMIVVFMVLR